MEIIGFEVCLQQCCWWYYRSELQYGIVEGYLGQVGGQEIYSRDIDTGSDKPAE